MKAVIINWHPDNQCGLVRFLENDVGKYSQYIIETTGGNKLLHIELGASKFIFNISSRRKRKKIVCYTSFLTSDATKYIEPGLYYVYRHRKDNDEVLRFDRIAEDESILISNIDSSLKISGHLHPLLSKCPTCNIDFLHCAGQYIYPWYTFKKPVRVGYCTLCGTGYIYKLFDDYMDIKAIV